jgi:hypothetical protein
VGAASARARMVGLIAVSLARAGLTSEARTTNCLAFVVLEVPTLTFASAGIGLRGAISRLQNDRDGGSSQDTDRASPPTTAS